MSLSDLDVAKKAAGKAGEIIRHYSKNRSELNIELKGRHDLVTKADVESEKAIIASIKQHRPNDRILGEESHDGSALTSDRTWIIDPIDGTTNFAHGFPVFCVSIALYENRKPLVGLVYEINSNELFYAEAGKGAYLNDKPMQVSTIDKADESLIGTGFPYRDLSLLDDYLKLFRVFMKETHGVRRPGSASYDLACVAAGRLDGFYEYGLAPWDVGAGAFIIQEAGGTVTDWKGGDNWLEGKRIVSGNLVISEYVLKRIQEFISEEYWV